MHNQEQAVLHYSDEVLQHCHVRAVAAFPLEEHSRMLYELNKAAAFALLAACIIQASSPLLTLPCLLLPSPVWEH